jgi:hypothetical protein
VLHIRNINGVLAFVMTDHWFVRRQNCQLAFGVAIERSLGVAGTEVVSVDRCSHPAQYLREPTTLP